jgi:hypothetical protein
MEEIIIVGIIIKMAEKKEYEKDRESVVNLISRYEFLLINNFDIYA